MRFGLFLLPVLLAGPAFADSPDSSPYPAAVETHAPAAPKAAVPKPAAPKAAETKPAAEKPAEAKPAADKPAKPATPQPTPSKTVTAKSEPAKSEPDAFTGIPPAERAKIQAALLWAGDTASAAKGEDPMVAAIKNYQRRKKANPTGVLTPDERADLLGAAKNLEDEVGWAVVVDPATGIRIGLPTKMVPQARDAERGTRWSSAHGDVQVETFRIADPELKLAALFEQQKKELNRKVETSVLRDDNFFISGLQGLKRFSVRATMRNGEVRGFTMMFDQMMETIVSPVMVAMSSAFSPFPERSAPFAALAKSVEYGNGLVVSAQGHIVTDRKLTEGCQVIVASGIGDAVRIADDKDTGLALLRVYGPRKLSVLALPRDTPKSGDLTLIGIPDPKELNGTKKLIEVKARLAEGGAIELRQPVPMAGFSGAAALDGEGRFLGMMEMRNAVLASTEPAAPPVRLVTAETIHDFLASHHVASFETQAGEAKTSVVRMICVRK
jgi:hypothetical protein